MAVRVMFRCEHCEGLPDPETQQTLAGQLRDRRLGMFLDAQPGGWLIWTAGGGLGSKRYSCSLHRDDLIDYVLRHYGAVRPRVCTSEPFPALWPDGFVGSMNETSLNEKECALG